MRPGAFPALLIGGGLIITAFLIPSESPAATQPKPTPQPKPNPGGGWGGSTDPDPTIGASELEFSLSWAVERIPGGGVQAIDVDWPSVWTRPEGDLVVDVFGHWLDDHFVAKQPVFVAFTNAKDAEANGSFTLTQERVPGSLRVVIDPAYLAGLSSAERVALGFPA